MNRKNEHIKLNDKIKIEKKLISQIKLNSCLYDRNHYDFTNNQEQIDKIWLTIASQLNKSVEDCQDIWNDLESNFRKFHSNNNNSWQHYESLKFLIPFIEESERISLNIETLDNEFTDDEDTKNLDGTEYDNVSSELNEITNENYASPFVLPKNRNKKLKNNFRSEYESKINAIIDEVKKYPCIYDTRVMESKNILMRQKAFQEISRVTGINSAKECKRLWKNLRGTLCKVHRSNNTDYKHYSKMKFFIPYLNIIVDSDQNASLENQKVTDGISKKSLDLSNKLWKELTESFDGKISHDTLERLIKEIEKYKHFFDPNTFVADDLRNASFENIVFQIPELESSEKCKIVWKIMYNNFVIAFQNGCVDYPYYSKMMFLNPILEKNNLETDETDKDIKINEQDNCKLYNQIYLKSIYEQRVIKLIEEVKKYPCLYSREPLDFLERKKLFEKISKDCPQIGSVVECQRLWKNLRDTFSKAYRNNQTNYVHYERLKFLISFVNKISTDGNEIIDHSISDLDLIVNIKDIKNEHLSNENQMNEVNQISLPSLDIGIMNTLNEKLVVELIEEVKKNPIIYNNTLKNSKKEYAVFEDISRKYPAFKSGEICLNIWKELRNTFTTTKDNNLQFAKNLQFLLPYCTDYENTTGDVVPDIVLAEETENKLKISDFSENQFKICGEIVYILESNKIVFSCKFCNTIYEDYHVFLCHVKNTHFYEQNILSNDKKDNDCDEEAFSYYYNHDIIESTDGIETQNKVDIKLLHSTKKQKKMNLDKVEIQVKCDICSLDFPNQKSLYRHKIYELQKFKCKHCGKCVLSRIALIQHENIHKRRVEVINKKEKEKISLECNLCNMQFMDYPSFYRHRIYEKQKYKCKFCGKCVLSITALNRHESTHTGEKKFQCDQCIMKFRDKQHLKNHINKHHLKLEKEKKYKCKYCEKAFKDIAGQRSHELVHTGEKPHVCYICGRGFARKKAYRDHIAVHENKRSIKCIIEECSKTFNTRAGMRDHLFSHRSISELNFDCSICGKKLKSRTALGRHKAKHSSVRPFDCKICGKSFPWRSLLDSHITSHPQFKLGVQEELNTEY